MYQSMKYMLDKAYAEKYAVMAINCFNLETARSVIKAAELDERNPSQISQRNRGVFATVEKTWLSN